jgi:hypothetical protein
MLQKTVNISLGPALSIFFNVPAKFLRFLGNQHLNSHSHKFIFLFRWDAIISN